MCLSQSKQAMIGSLDIQMNSSNLYVVLTLSRNNFQHKGTIVNRQRHKNTWALYVSLSVHVDKLPDCCFSTQNPSNAARALLVFPPKLTHLNDNISHPLYIFRMQEIWELPLRQLPIFVFIGQFEAAFIPVQHIGVIFFIWGGFICKVLRLSVTRTMVSLPGVGWG